MSVNRSIAFTYIFAQKKLTAVAVFGVVLGMSIYIFMNCLVVGFDAVSYNTVFKSTPHIRLFQEDKISSPLVSDTASRYLIVNPKVVPHNNRIINPQAIKEQVLKNPLVRVVSLQVTSSVFYNIGKNQIAGVAIGVNPDDANLMFNLSSITVEGRWEDLKTNPNGILIGSGIAQKMSLRVGDNINITSSKNFNKNLKVLGIIKASNAKIDNTTSYVNLGIAQQMLRENGDYVTDVNINLNDFHQANEVATELSELTGYKAEGFEQSNESLMAGNRTRKIVIIFISYMLLVVAGFGIYNILNLTVSQKISEIAILKAMGFKGKDVISIFVTQALAIGCIGVIGGLLLATLIISLVKKVYIGGDIGHFPIDFELNKYIQGTFVGLAITFLAGYIPARKASKVDPVSIFRR